MLLVSSWVRVSFLNFCFVFVFPVSCLLILVSNFQFLVDNGDDGCFSLLLGNVHQVDDGDTNKHKLEAACVRVNTVRGN